jgi:hypothetical protein
LSYLTGFVRDFLPGMQGVIPFSSRAGTIRNFVCGGHNG